MLIRNCAMALQKIYRMGASKMIDMVMKKGKRVQTPFFRVFLLPSRLSSHKIAITVSPKIEAKAVRRNRIKRRLSEAIRKVITEHPKISPTLAVFWGSQRIYDAAFEEIVREVEKSITD
ncbi:ribonuclease P protein component [Candidatus Peregrinibacteria bacterium]|nr:ribonuclease P protein component [Candidatus Peregrinibacteria bacterium]